MKNAIIKTLVAASLAVMAGGAMADTGKIAFQGVITQGAYTLGAGQQGTNMVVDMPQVPANKFTAAGDRSPAADFSITLLDCDVTTLNTAAFSFRPDAGSVVGTGLLSLENAGGAQNIAIRLEDDAGTQILFGGAAKSFTLVKGNNVLNFKAYFEATATGVTAGNARARAFFDVTYS
ncbi:fimbrial protein [Bordetella avium]|uniref:fimbrial protein n=1 Tax=Bordetella avium TaxID=521 RepID=UPI000E67AF56|nr:fimbrial protein [Bordetella avium]RIQ57491.1 type 1 fimbrial protein [Bordetella avium]